MIFVSMAIDLLTEIRAPLPRSLAEFSKRCRDRKKLWRVEKDWLGTGQRWEYYAGWAPFDAWTRVIHVGCVSSTLRKHDR